MDPKELQAQYAEHEAKADTLFQKFVAMPYSLAAFVVFVLLCIGFGMWIAR